MQVGKLLRWALLPLVLTMFVFGTVSNCVAAPSSDATLTDRESAIQTGTQLEKSRQWLDAIEHYEAGIESWPDSKDLEYGLRRSKIQFGIDRRYVDASYEHVLLNKSRSQSLRLFSQVLYHVQANYVVPISSTTFVAHGTESLYLALSNRKFLAFHLPNADPSRIARMRKILKDEYWNKPVANSTAAGSTLAQVCDRAGDLLGLSSSAVIMEYVFGGCNALDDYSSCLTPDRNTDLQGNIDGNFVGLGIEMRAESGKGMLLVNVLPTSPAEEGGMLPGDWIVLIDGKDCRNMTTDEAAKLLRGTVGSRVRLSLVTPTADDGEAPRRRENTFVRRHVEVKSIPVAEIVDAQHGIAYIQMNGFQKSTPSELDAALQKLRARGMRSLIWDVRGNPGGLLNGAAEVLDRFIDRGVLVSTRGRTQDHNDVFTAYRQRTWNMPLVLLIDGDSASASEIVAGALRDHKRGTIVGRKTYGKWSVQNIFRLNDNIGLRLTTAKFYSPNGENLSKIGLEPDVEVPKLAERRTYYRGSRRAGASADSDADLKRGIELLRGQLTRR